MYFFLFCLYMRTVPCCQALFCFSPLIGNMGKARIHNELRSMCQSSIYMGHARIHNEVSNQSYDHDVGLHCSWMIGKDMGNANGPCPCEHISLIITPRATPTVGPCPWARRQITYGASPCEPRHRHDSIIVRAMPWTIFDMQAMPTAIYLSQRAMPESQLAFFAIARRKNTGQSRVVELIMHRTLRDPAYWPVACFRHVGPVSTICIAVIHQVYGHCPM